jgi:hypothetical protein
MNGKRTVFGVNQAVFGVNQEGDIAFNLYTLSILLRWAIVPIEKAPEIKEFELGPRFLKVFMQQR